MTDESTFVFEYQGVECVAHAAQPDDDCEFCHTEMQDRAKHYDACSKEMSKRGQALAHRNGALDPASLIEMRLNLFIEVVLGGNVRERVKFETKFMEAMHNVLGEALQEITRQQLLMGPQQAPPMQNGPGAFPDGLFGK